MLACVVGALAHGVLPNPCSVFVVFILQALALARCTA